MNKTITKQLKINDTLIDVKWWKIEVKRKPSKQVSFNGGTFFTDEYLYMEITFKEEIPDEANLFEAIFNNHNLNKIEIIDPQGADIYSMCTLASLAPEIDLDGRRVYGFSTSKHERHNKQQ